MAYKLKVPYHRHPSSITVTLLEVWHDGPEYIMAKVMYQSLKGQFMGIEDNVKITKEVLKTWQEYKYDGKTKV